MSKWIITGLGFLLGLLLGEYIASASIVIVYQDHPIIKDQTITVDTYYDDELFDGYHTIIYSTRQPENLFFHQVNWNAIDIIHQWAKCWITQQINEAMIARCQCEPILSSPSNSSTNSSCSNLELYSISEEDEN